MKFFHFRERNLPKGIILVLIAWLCFSTLWALSKVMETQTTVPTMIFFRSVVGIILVLPWVIKRWPKSLKINNKRVVFIRSIVGLVNLVFILLAVQQISIVNTTLLNNSAPFFVPFLLVIFFKTPIQHKLWPAIALGFIGVFLVLHPDERIFNWGAIYGLLSGICLATMIVTMRITTHSETLVSFLLYFFLIGLVAVAPFAILNWKVESMMTLVGLLSMGLLSLIGQIFLFHGLKFGKAHELAPFSYSTVIFAGLFDWFLWGNIPEAIAYLGMALIIAGGLWIAYIGRFPRKVD